MFDVKCMILVLLMHWQRQNTTLCSGYQSFDLVKKRSSGWASRGWNISEVDLGGKHACKTVVSLLLPAVDALFHRCRGRGCVIAQLFADAHYGYIRCWIHPESHSLLNHIRPGPCSIDPGLSRETDAWSQLDSGRNPRCKIHFWLGGHVSRRAKRELPCFCRGRNAVEDLWSLPEDHRFHAPEIYRLV